MSTADKKNAYRIQVKINQAIFKELIMQQGSERFKYTSVAKFDRPMLSNLAIVATNAIMKDPRLNVVLRKER